MLIAGVVVSLATLTEAAPPVCVPEAETEVTVPDPDEAGKLMSNLGLVAVLLALNENVPVEPLLVTFPIDTDCTPEPLGAAQVPSPRR